jgi:hypothetical protein
MTGTIGRERVTPRAAPEQVPDARNLFPGNIENGGFQPDRYNITVWINPKG